MKNTIATLAAFLALSFTGSAEVILFSVKPARAEKDYGIKIKTQQLNPRQAGVTLEFPEDGELKLFRCVEMRIVQGDRSLLFATLPTKTENGVVTARFDVDPALLPDCQFTIYHYLGKHGDVGYRIKVRDFLAADKPAPESRPVASTDAS
jgi:hypothetical protein